jgi:hypothetical protein
MPQNLKKLLASGLPEFRRLASSFSSEVKAHFPVAGAYVQYTYMVRRNEEIIPQSLSETVREKIRYLCICGI